MTHLTAARLYEFHPLGLITTNLSSVVPVTTHSCAPQYEFQRSEREMIVEAPGLRSDGLSLE